MAAMNSIERIGNILKRKPVDRVGVDERFWGDTQRKWTEQGYLVPDESLQDHFGFDMQECWAFDLVARLGFEPEVIDETDETVLKRDGNGALLRYHKLHSSTPEHVDFLVKDRAGWEEHVKPFLTPDRGRLRLDGYRETKRLCADRQRFFCWAGVNVFESMHPVCGHEYLLMGMLTDPDWIKDMVETYAQLTVDLFEMLFAEEGLPDGVFFYEDMGFKEHAFISPDMYREFILPGHLKNIQYCKNRGLPVIMHSCGFVESLVPGMIEAGIDCLQAIEIKAGMDLLRLHRDYGDRLSLMGGMDVRKLYTNDKAEIEAELIAKLPTVKKGFGYILHSDHSIPDTVDYESYRFFVERGLELGTY